MGALFWILSVPGFIGFAIAGFWAESGFCNREERKNNATLALISGLVLIVATVVAYFNGSNAGWFTGFFGLFSTGFGLFNFSEANNEIKKDSINSYRTYEQQRTPQVRYQEIYRDQTTQQPPMADNDPLGIRR